MGKLSSTIVQRKLASLRDVEEALARQVLYGGDLATNVLEQAAPKIDERALTALLAELSNLPPAPAGELPRAPADALGLMPGDVALRHGLYPLSRSNQGLVVAVSEPMNPDVEQDLAFGLGVTIQQQIAPLVRIRQAISRDYGMPLDRRSHRVLAKLEGKPDPSPSIAPAPLESAPDIASLPRPPSIPVLGLPMPMDMGPLYGSAAEAASRVPKVQPIIPRVPVSIGPAVHTPRMPDAEPSSDGSIHERLTSPAPLVAPTRGDETRPLPPVALPTAPGITAPASQPPAPRAASEPPAPRAASQPPASRAASQPPAPRAASEPPAPRAASQPPAPGAASQPPAPRAASQPPAPRVASEPPAPRAASQPPVAPRKAHAKVAMPLADLATWGIQSKQADKRGRAKHRGPYTAAAAEQDLLNADARDAVLTAFFEFACQYFEYSALFAVHSDLAEGRSSHGPGADHAKITGIGVPLDLPGSLATARREGRFIITALGKEGLDARLVTDLERPQVGKVLLLPLLMRERCVLLLYGDEGKQDVDLTTVGDVIAFAPLVATALENVILRKKTAVRQAVGADDASVGRQTSLRPQQRQRVLMPSREERAEALAQALENTVRPVSASRPPPAPAAMPLPLPPLAAPAVQPAPAASVVAPVQPAPATSVAPVQPNPNEKRRPTNPSVPAARAAAVFRTEPEQATGGRRSITPPRGTPLEASTPAPEASTTGPVFPLSRRATPAATEAAKERVPGAPAERPPAAREPDDAPEVSYGTEEVDWSGDDDPTLGIPDSQVVVPAKAPVRPHSSAELRLPTVILNIEDDLEALVKRLLDGDEAALARLGQLGAAAASLLVTRFPGPIHSEPDRLGSPEPASHRGPVLRALVRIGQAAVPFLAVRSNDADPTIRGWATQLLGEIPSTDSAAAVGRRVTDSVSEVRRAAIEAGKMLQADEDSRTALRDRVLTLAEATSSPIETRIAALEALAQFRDGRSVPRLVRLVAAGGEVAQSAQWALGVITRQAFGSDVAAWEAWWNENGEHHRIEWLIAALMHEDAEIRRAAGEELKALTKEYFGYYDDLSKSERAKAQHRYLEWWESAGKARFSPDVVEPEVPIPRRDTVPPTGRGR